MKILFLVHDFLPEHVGGTEVHSAELARELFHRGHEVVIVCTERDLARAEGEVLERRYGKLRVLEVAHAREYACAEESWEEPRQQAIFDSLLAREKPDIVHVQHFAQWGTGVLASAHARALPSVVTLHDYYLLCANACLFRGDGSLCRGDCSQCLQGLPAPRSGGPQRSLDSVAQARRAQHRAHLGLASAVIAPSHFLASLMIERGIVSAERISRLDSGVAGPWREPRASDPARPLRLAFVGGIYPTKGVHVLLEAFASMRPGLATLDIHGVLEWFPSYVGHLRALAGERADLRWRGRFAPEDLDTILDEIDVLVVPSLWYENRPLTIQAAFRRGICVIASDLGGMAELVVPGLGGELFRRGDAPALAGLLSELARNRARVLELARARPALPTMAEIAGRHLEIYARASLEMRPVL